MGPQGRKGGKLTRKSLLLEWKKFLEHKLHAVEIELQQLQLASMAETKSSAGDKYETAREMLAQSRRILEKSEDETRALLMGLERMLQTDGSGPIHFGSLVRLDETWYLIGLNAGAYPGDDGEVQGISLQSPLGQALKGKHKNESISWRQKSLQIRDIQAD
jgi:transcription elongation GreA/GreB family factor